MFNLKLPDPIAIFTNNTLAARAWFAVAAFLAAWVIIQPYFVVLAMKQEEKAVILDGAGNLVYAPVLGFEEAGSLQAYHLRLAMLAAFQRHPHGLDLPDLANRLYLEPARSKLRRLVQATAPDFAARQMRQKVELSSLRILETKTVDGKETYLAEVRGQLIRSGSADGLPFVEPVGFTVRLTLVRNPDLLANGKLPLAVHEFDYQESSR